MSPQHHLRVVENQDNTWGAGLVGASGTLEACTIPCSPTVHSSPGNIGHIPSLSQSHKWHWVQNCHQATSCSEKLASLLGCCDQAENATPTVPLQRWEKQDSCHKQDKVQVVPTACQGKIPRNTASLPAWTQALLLHYL